MKIKNKYLLFLLPVLLISFSQCEMEEETHYDPKLVIIQPANGDQVYADSTMLVTGRLIGFEDNHKPLYFSAHLKDSLIYTDSIFSKSLEYTINTAGLPIGTDTMNFMIDYLELPKDRDWNYFNIRDLIEGEQQVDSAILEKRVGVNIVSP